MRFLLTGGAGHVGSACLRRLLAHGHEAIAYDDLSTGNRKAVPADRLIEGDIFSISHLEYQFRSKKIDAVMHFAALASVPESIADPDAYYAANMSGTKCVVDAMRLAGVKNIIFSSTAAVYSHRATSPISEDATLDPATPYGRSKLAAEYMVRDYCKAYGMAGTIFRYFNAAGADFDGEHGECRRQESHLIPLAIRAAIERKPLKVHGDDYPTPDGTCQRDYVHVYDLANAHELAAKALVPGKCPIYNLGSGRARSVLEVLEMVRNVSGVRVIAEFADRRPGDPSVLMADIRNARDELGWMPTLGMGAIICNAWEWHSRHPEGYLP